jgi:hypothetical protein
LLWVPSVITMGRPKLWWVTANVINQIESLLVFRRLRKLLSGPIELKGRRLLLWYLRSLTEGGLTWLEKVSVSWSSFSALDSLYQDVPRKQ